MEIVIIIQTHYDGNLEVLLVTVIEIIFAYGVLLLICEICEQAGQDFEECSNMVDQLNWYLFPIKIQRMMPLISYFTQQPIEIKCFGGMACNRETFKYVSANKSRFIN